MRQAIDAAGPVLIAALLLVIGSGLLGTLTSLYLAHEAGAAWLAGVAASAYFAGQMAGAVYGQRSLRAVGHIRAFAAFSAVAAAAAILQPMLGVGWGWVALRFVFGFGVVVMTLSMESWLNATVWNEARGSVFSVYMIAVYAGLALGQAPVAALDITAATGFNLAAICVILASVPMSLTARAQPALEDDKPLSIWRIFAASPTGALCALASGALIGSVVGLGPVYARSVGLDESGVATFMAVFLLAGLVSSWPLGRLSDRIDRRIVILAIAFALAGAGAAGALAERQNLVLAFGLAGIFGLCALPLYSLAVAHANDVMAAESPVATAGGMIVGFGLGALAAPLAVSALMDVASAAAFPAAMGAIALVTAVFVLIRMGASPPLPVEDKTPHQPLPRTTAVAYALDPWSASEEEAEEDAPAVESAPDQAETGDEEEEPGWRDAWFTPEPDEDQPDSADDASGEAGETPHTAADREN